MAHYSTVDNLGHSASPPMDSIKSSDKLLSIYHPHHLRPDDFNKPYSKAATINNFTLDCASKFETLLSELTNDDLAVLHNRIHEFRSGSTWKLEHLLVFNVVPVLDLDWRKVIPQEYNPNNKIDQTNGMSLSYIDLRQSN